MIPIVAAAVAALLFAQAVVRLRRRGRADLAGWDRIALFALGLGVTLFALVGPLDDLADDKLLFAHMGQHVLIGDLGPALMIVALRGPLLVFLLPAPVLGPIARNARRARRPRRRCCGRASRSRSGRRTSRSGTSRTSTTSRSRTRTSTTSSTSAGWSSGRSVWTLLVDPGSGTPADGRRPVALAAAMFAAGQILTDVLVFTFTPLYPFYHGAYGISALADQQISRAS